jgi:hypothetical protein
MGRPRKIQVDIQEEVIDVKSSTNSFPIAVIDPTSTQQRVLEAYNQAELDSYLANGWLIFG